MMYRLQYAPAARQDLRQIKAYIISEFSDSNLADTIIRKITKSIRQLEVFPLKGHPLTNMIDVPTDYLYFVTEKNYVFYRTEAHMVKVVRILNERQDFMHILFGIIEADDWEQGK